MQLTAVRTLTAVLAAPQLQASVSGSTATLSWTPPVPTGQSVIAGYRVYKGPTAGSQPTLLATTNATSLPDTLSGTQFYRVEAFDQYQTGNSSGPLSCSPAGGQQFKFPQGHWIVTDSGQSLDTQYAQLDTIGAKKNAGFNISGVFVRMDWSSMEGATQGDFAAGFAQWDRFIAKANLYGLKIGFHLNYQKYNKPQTTFPGYFPAYLAGAAFGPTSNDGTNFFFGGVWTCANSSGNGGFTQCAMLWNTVSGVSSVRDALVNLIKAYGLRYNGNQTVQLFTPVGEEPPVVAGYSDAKHLAILTGANGIFPQGAAAWPNTILRIMNNYAQNDAGMLAIMNAAIANDWAAGGGPDCCNGTGEVTPSGTATPNTRNFECDQLWQNQPGKPNGTGASLAGKYWWIAEVENPEQGLSGFTRPAQFGSGYNIDMLHHANLQGAQLMLWAWNGFTGPNDNRTVTNPPNTHPDLWDFLDANPLANTSYPSNVPFAGGPVPAAPTSVKLYSDLTPTTLYAICDMPGVNGGPAITQLEGLLSPSGIVGVQPRFTAANNGIDAQSCRVDFYNVPPGIPQTVQVRARNVNGAGGYSSASANSVSAAAFTDTWTDGANMHVWLSGGTQIGKSQLVNDGYFDFQIVRYVDPGAPTVNPQVPGRNAPAYPLGFGFTNQHMVEVSPQTAGQGFGLLVNIMQTGLLVGQNGIYNLGPYRRFVFFVYPTGGIIEIPTTETTYNVEGIVSAVNGTALSFANQTLATNTFPPGSTGIFDRENGGSAGYVSNTATTITNGNAGQLGAAVGHHVLTQVGDQVVGNYVGNCARFVTWPTPGVMTLNTWNQVEAPLDGTGMNALAANNHMLYKWALVGTQLFYALKTGFAV